MHARILLLPGSEKGEINCSYAEQLLTDISAAFDHSFSLLRGKIGAEIPDKTLDTCEDSQGIFLGDAACPGAQPLYDALNMPLRIRSFCIPETLCSRHETPIKMWLGTVLSLDQETLRAAMQFSFRFAREEDARILHVSPAGGKKEDWDAAVRVQTVSNPLVTCDAMAAQDAAAALVLHPGKLGLLLCPPYAGGILEASATALCAHPEMMYDLVPGEETLGIYAPYLPEKEEGDAPAPFAAALAIARMLRHSLRLSREAACLDAAIQNVLANSFLTSRREEKNGQDFLDLICEQIAVAGELMSKGGINA